MATLSFVALLVVMLVGFTASIVGMLRYATGCPLHSSVVYRCDHNGVTGVVLARDYSRAIREMRRWCRRLRKSHFVWANPLGYRVQVYPVFLFSDKKPKERNFLVGNMEQLGKLLKGCYVEQHAFELPPVSAGGMTPYFYRGTWEQVGREGTRHRIYDYDSAYRYVHSYICDIQGRLSQ